MNLIDEMFAGVINLKELDLTNFDTQNVYSCDGIWNDITELNIMINVSKNRYILEYKPEGTNVTDISDNI